MDIGIPYAYRVEGGVKCPECGKLVIEGYDSTGEATTNNYAAHFSAAHQAAAEEEKA